MRRSRKRKKGGFSFDHLWVKELYRYYLLDSYEIDDPALGGIKEKIYLGGDAYTAPAVAVKEGGSWNIYYLCRDYLGSITHIATGSGSLVQELSYDAWGRLRNPANQQAYAPDSEPVLFLGRGYTGHEHLPQFGLINMNARLYDPALGRFLSPDPYVQSPDFSQNFNRYSYCLNNPLRYTDENGEFWHIIIGAVIGGIINVAIHWNQIDSFGEGLAAFGIGAAGGALAAATGGLAMGAFGTGIGAGGFIGGAVAGGVGYTSNTAITGIGNHIAFGDPLPTAKQFVTGLGISMLTGGAINGTFAALNGRNFLTGKLPTPKHTMPDLSRLTKPDLPKTELQGPQQQSLARMEVNDVGPTMTSSGELSYQVTPEGVVLPKGLKYEIPSELIEAPYNIPRSTTYGVEINGKFNEVLRIDAATMPGYKGPNFSHYHLYRMGKHYVPTTNDPGFIELFKIKF